MHSPALTTAMLVAANALIPLAVLLFAIGFFPHKPFIPGLATYARLDEGDVPAPPFDRVVFMVVDALRSDFVYLAGSGFEYTQKLILNGVAMPFTAYAASPTITMPKIKAITTGSVPSFLDVILNFDEQDKTSSLATQDTWLAQMKAKGTGKLVMYGDDTWIKLFPDTFDRAEGTSSFFVSDFTEVDNNVTRHIDRELKQTDWNTLVLHYLGLDHIGHKAGPRSPNMIPKQREMDGIVKHIYEAIESESHLQSTLFVICGDHGMNDAGNHGASSAGETSPALVFMSPKLKTVSKPPGSSPGFREDFQYYTQVQQSDIAPTLAGLLGFPPPKNNLGNFISEFLPFWPNQRDRVHILMQNVKQILEIVTAAFGAPMFDTSNKLSCENPDSAAEELACGWRNVALGAQAIKDNAKLPETWYLDAAKWLRNAQSLMSSAASNYDMPKLFMGQTVALLAAGASIAAARLSISGPAYKLWPFVLATLAYGIMMFASSYVEEEHHFWYWAASGWFLYLSVKELNKSQAKSSIYALGTLAAIRIIRGWNQTGQKFAGEPDIVKLYMQKNSNLLWALTGITYLLVSGEIFRSFQPLPAGVPAVLTGYLAVTAFSFKVAFTIEDAPELLLGLPDAFIHIFKGLSLVAQARLFFLGFGVASSVVIFRRVARGKKTERVALSLHHLYTLLAITQTRTTSIPLFLFLQIQLYLVRYMGLDLIDISTTSMFLQFLSFFAFGGTNAISSVDLSNAYNGVSGFNVVAVGILTFVSNWAGTIFWTSATNVLLQERRALGDNHLFKQHISLLTVFTACAVAFVMAACTALRTHLFIWTVFSPKYLYSMAWSLGQHLLINIGLGAFLNSLGK